MRCPNCGAEIPDGSVQCPNCGVRILQNQGPYYPNQNPSYAPRAGKGKLIAIIAVVVAATLIVAGIAILFSSPGNAPSNGFSNGGGTSNTNTNNDIEFKSKMIGEHSWRLEVSANDIDPENLTYAIEKSDGTFLVSGVSFPADQKEDVNGVTWVDMNSDGKVDTGDVITITNDLVDGSDTFMITSGATGSVLLSQPIRLVATHMNQHRWRLQIIPAQDRNISDLRYSIQRDDGTYLVSGAVFPTTSGYNDTHGVTWNDLQADGRVNAPDIISINNADVYSGYTFIIYGGASGSITLP